MNIKEIKELIKQIDKSPLNRVVIETNDFKLKIVREEPVKKKVLGELKLQSHSVPAILTAQQIISTAPVEEPGAAPLANASLDNSAMESGWVRIKSPMIGTFYASPSPDKPKFVTVGSDISVGDPVCIIEAMKLFNEIESEVSGKVMKILANEGEAVEHGMSLMLVRPN